MSDPRYQVAGTWPFDIRIAEHPLRFQRRAANGLCDPDGGEILISPTLPPDRRLPVLLHEMAHAWFRTFNGVPRDEEVLCDFVGTFTMATMRWLDRAGGVPRLLQLRPGEALLAIREEASL